MLSTSVKDSLQNAALEISDAALQNILTQEAVDFTQNLNFAVDRFLKNAIFKNGKVPVIRNQPWFIRRDTCEH